MKKHKPIQVGDVFPTNEGGSVVVVEYNGWDNVVVRHNSPSGHVMVTRSDSVRSGMVKDPYRPKSYGIGYLGAGKHAPFKNGKETKAYVAWHGILTRCYSSQFLKSNPAYEGCSVDENWHNFQNFAEWFYAQPNCDKKGFAVDKDLIFMGRKIYSEESCSLVPQQINNILLDSASIRGDLPIGVSAHQGKYRAHIGINGKRVHLGSFSNPEEAYISYKTAKIDYVRSMAEKYKDVLHPRVYENLSNWTL